MTYHFLPHPDYGQGHGVEAVVISSPDPACTLDQTCYDHLASDQAAQLKNRKYRQISLWRSVEGLEAVAVACNKGTCVVLG